MKKPVVYCGGFTLIELLMTLALVGLLASLVVPLAEVAAQRERETELRQTLRTVREAIDNYKRAVDEGRVARSADESGYPANLEILAAGMVDQRDPKGAKLRFLRQVPRDPLARDASVPAAQTWGKRSYASSHEAPAAGRDIFDVYSLDSGAGLNGVRYRDW